MWRKAELTSTVAPAPDHLMKGLMCMSHTAPDPVHTPFAGYSYGFLAWRPLQIAMVKNTILAEIATKQFLETNIFVIIFVIISKIIPPEYFLCNVAATGLSLFAREHAKESAL